MIDRAAVISRETRRIGDGGNWLRPMRRGVPLLTIAAKAGWFNAAMSCMLKLTKEEIAFLRWLRTNGGTASLSNIPTGFTERVIGTRYVLAEPDAYRPALRATS